MVRFGFLSRAVLLIRVAGRSLSVGLSCLRVDR